MQHVVIEQPAVSQPRGSQPAGCAASPGPQPRGAGQAARGRVWRRLRRAAWIAGLAGLLAGIPEAAAKELRVATLAPDGSSWMKILGRGAQEIAKRTAGRVTYKYYAGGVQGDERDVVRKLKLGQLDGAVLTSVGLSMIDESIRVLELPNLFASVDELDHVRDKMWPYFEKKFAAKGFALGAPGDVGFIYFYTNNEVNKLDDLRKAKVWMWADDTIVRTMFKKLGINGVPLGVPDVLSSLQTGRINACYSSPLAAVALQWYTKVKYVTSLPMSYAIGASVTRAATLGELTPADRTEIDKVMRIAGSKLRKTVRQDNDRATAAIQKSGVRTVQTSPEMVKAFDGAASQVWTELTGKMFSREELQMVLKHRDEYRQQHKK
jgi:TRAP-type C4-dicarboxylate transport system substrate-binding protein